MYQPPAPRPPLHPDVIPSPTQSMPPTHSNCISDQYHLNLPPKLKFEMQPLSFHLFPLLPTEIRLKIWHHASTHTRVLDFRAKIPRPDRLGQQEYLRYLKRVEFNTRCLGSGQRSDVQWRTSVQAPGVLSACVESREVALTIYTLVFELVGVGLWGQDVRKRGEGGSGTVVHINPRLDTVYGDVYSSLLVHYLVSDLQASDVEEQRGTRWLALNENCFAESLVCRPPDGLRGSGFMEGLEGLVFVTEVMDQVGESGEWILVESEMSLGKQMSWIGRKPAAFWETAMRNVAKEKRPEFRICALKRAGS